MKLLSAIMAAASIVATPAFAAEADTITIGFTASRTGPLNVDSTGQERTSANVRSHVGFSNRPFGVKHFQTFRDGSVDVAHGLALLFGIGTKALPSWGSKTRWNNLSGGLTVGQRVGPSRHANSPHPSSREGHHSTLRGIQVFSYGI